MSVNKEDVMLENLTDNPALDHFLRKILGELKGFTEAQESHIHELVKIGLALSAEKNLNRLLEMIVSEACRFTNADGGTLYIKSEDGEFLDFAIVQNDSLNVRMGGPGEAISWPPVPLKTSDGQDNERNVSAYCALTGKAINIVDVYFAEGFDFQGTKDFDKTTGYRSKSMLVLPMRDHEDEVIGVLQLLNAQDRETGEVVGFPENEIEFITSLASQAAIAINNVRLIEGLENLLNSFVKAIAAAIDEKSPYTGGHIERVAELTEHLALEINRSDSGRFKEVSFSPEELSEIRMAAWMHDVGKISTPEYVVDKSTKLETIFDRIEIVRCRVEILKKEAEIRELKKRLGPDVALEDNKDLGQEIAGLDETLSFLESVNIGGEFLTDDRVARIKELAAISFEMNGSRMPLINDEEMKNLMIRKGTLTNEEREIINNHVNVGIKMLSSLPFPKKLRRVPALAGAHHEKLDGSGYPNGLKNGEIPNQARILAVADVFEALTAADRPYKEGKLLSESMRILGFMEKDNHLDADLCELLVESGIIQEYAGKHLSARQRDGFEWKGKKYAL